MLILAFDTSAAHCAAALLSGDRVLAARSEDMARGQAEALMPLIEAVLAEAGHEWRDLDRIGVGTGPGNFTGIRIAVSAARGLALALGIPAIGVDTFDAILAGPGSRRAAVPAPRDRVWVRDRDEAPASLPRAEAGDATFPPDPREHAIRIARLAATRASGAPPAPVYLRPADAAPASDPPPVILDDA